MARSILFAVGPLAFILPADAAVDNDPGAQLAAACASCHRAAGKNNAIPSIAGIAEERLTRAMLAYKSGERVSHIMQAVSQSLSEEEIATVARYLAAQGKKAKPP
jgi:sulfide dehydrogenase cytochrome subunit